jgi:hypothetical protein
LERGGVPILQILFRKRFSGGELEQMVEVGLCPLRNCFNVFND